MKIEIKGKIKINPPGNYLLIIEDEEETYHYWLSDGTYDGCDIKCKEVKENEQ